MSNQEKELTLVDALTGQVEQRSFTDEERAEYQASLADLSASQNALEAKTIARQSALAKLAALGLTEEEIAAL
jgi:DNA-binding NarL/FixJ family response regulator